MNSFRGLRNMRATGGDVCQRQRGDVCQRQVAIYANDRVRFMRTTGTANESGRRQNGGFIQPQNDGGLATSRYSIIK